MQKVIAIVFAVLLSSITHTTELEQKALNSLYAVSYTHLTLPTSDLV